MMLSFTPTVKTCRVLSQLCPIKPCRTYQSKLIKRDPAFAGPLVQMKERKIPAIESIVEHSYL